MELVNDPFNVVLTLSQNGNRLTELEQRCVHYVYRRALRAAELERDVAKLETSMSAFSKRV